MKTKTKKVDCSKWSMRKFNAFIKDILKRPGEKKKMTTKNKMPRKPKPVIN